MNTQTPKGKNGISKERKGLFISLLSEAGMGDEAVLPTGMSQWQERKKKRKKNQACPKRSCNHIP